MFLPFCAFCSKRSDVPESLQKAQLKDLKVMTTIGVGGFGTVELVRPDFVRVCYYLRKGGYVLIGVS